MNDPAPPQLPDPTATAAAQATMNKETAVAQAGLNSTNQVTPDGSLTYSQSGTWADGTPQFTATTALSGANQGIYDTNQATKQNIATIGKDQSARIGDLLGSPLNVDQAVSDKITSLGKQRLDPQWDQNQQTLETSLANKGIQVGSAAYDASMRDFNQGKNDAYNSLYLNGNQQAEQQALTERNQPINEITALMSGSQVSNPTFQSTPQTQVAGVDYTGMVNNNTNAAANQYAQQLGQSNAAMGGMFGLGGTLGGAALKYGGGAALFSDRRLKRDVRRIGATDDGLPIYRYQYVWGGPYHIGVMADEIEGVNPSAVSTHESGFKMVDYAQVGA